ncbi:MAG: sensor histidine kinase [Actinomycetota bacterium]|nr:sensor histidine kinase [Actinomycetota bacterium]
MTAGPPTRHYHYVRMAVPIAAPARLPDVVVGVVTVLCGLAGAVLYQVNSAVGRSLEPSFWLVSTCTALAYGGTGVFLAARDRSPVIRRVLLGIGLCHGFSVLCREYGVLAAAAGRPLAGAAVWAGNWLWAPAHVAIGALLPLLLPDGRVPSRRWLPALGLSVTAVAGTAVWWALLPYDLHDYPFDVAGLRNPVGAAAVAAPLVTVASAALNALAVVVALASAVFRWRRSGEAQRQQLKWLLLGGLATVALFLVGLTTPQPTGEVISGLAVLPLPLACAVAVLRYRLWDVDVVISRSLRYGLLSAVVVAGYVAAVGVLSGILGAGTGAPILATTVVALLVLPLHGWLQRLVNRLVHGDAEDPYTALARLGNRLAVTADPTEVASRVLPEVLAKLARVFRLRYAAIELANGETIAHGNRPSDVARLPLKYGGAKVGELLLATDGPGSVTEHRRLDLLAQQAAIAAHALLLARDVQRSRQLVVTAREEERRQLRRDLHDGMGPALAAVALQAETARDLVDRDPAEATALLDRLVPRLNDAVREVRALVHQLRPPTLDELGLPGALRELATRFATPGTTVQVEIGELGTLPAAVDVAAYRIVAEALTNAVRHASAGTVRVSVHRTCSRLELAVSDDGSGIDPAAGRGVGLASMRERAAELDGQCTIGAAQGGGTLVTATLPLRMEKSG